MGTEEAADSFCATCGVKRDSILSGFCNNCGNKFDEEPVANVASDPVATQPPPYQQQYGQPPVNPAYQQPYAQQPYGQSQFRSAPQDYIRPSDYVFTTTVWERVIGTLKMNMHVVEEIEERNDLQGESRKVLLLSLFIISVLESMWVLVFPASNWVIVSPVGVVIETFIDTFSSAYILIYMLAAFGKRFGGYGTNVDREEMERVLAYAYTAIVIEGMVNLIDAATYSLIISLLWVVVWIYSALVMIYAIRRVLDKGYATAIITYIIAFVITLLLKGIIMIIVEIILGVTWYIM